MEVNEFDQIDALLRVLYTEGDQAWYYVYTKAGVRKEKADRLYKIAKADGRIETKHKGSDFSITDPHEVGLTDAGLSWFSKTNYVKEYVDKKDENEKIQNIFTNHIYGNNNPLNIATGVHVTQNNTTNSLKSEDEETLKSLGVDQKEIEELRNIIDTNFDNKPSLTKKSMKWLGSVSATVAARGLYDNIPAITDFMHKLIF